MLKLNTLKVVCVLLAALLVAQSLTVEQTVQKGVLQIQPSALQSLRNYFDIVVVLLKQGKEKDGTEESFLNMVHNLNETVPTQSSRLFGILDINDDVQQSLKKFQFSHFPSIQLMTKKKVYEYTGEVSGLIEFYENNLHPKLHLYDSLEEAPNNTLVLAVNHTEMDYSRAQKLSNKIIESIREFDLGISGIRGNKSEIYLKGANFTIQYQSDPEEIPSILQFVSVETLPMTFEVTDDNFHRVFGSPIDTQVILVYNESIPVQTIELYKARLFAVAKHNREKELRYERLIFASISMAEAGKLFGDLLEDISGSLWRLLITKTDYNSFQLERYMRENDEGEFLENKAEKFIEDYRMKRLEPYYRSQKKPEEQTEGEIWKVVGKTFQEFVYGSRDKSALILFIDSKEPESYKEWEKELRNFADKYKQHLVNEVKVGIFDLALNEHKLLHLDFAPQIVLFEKTNKKRARSFRGELNQYALRDWLNYWIKTLNIPEHFGQKPLELGL